MTYHYGNAQSIGRTSENGIGKQVDGRRITVVQSVNCCILGPFTFSFIRMDPGNG